MGDSGPVERFCPQCKQQRPLTDFEALPLDLRCKACIPVDQALVLYDKRVQQAGNKLSQVLESAKATELRPLEQMLDGLYDAWGGAAPFCEDLVRWINEKADEVGGKGRRVAIDSAIKLLQLHAKVDSLKIEEDWNQLSRDQIEERLRKKMMALWVEQNLPEEKANAIKHIMGGSD